MELKGCGWKCQVVLYLKEATVIYGFYLLAARLPELTWVLETARTCSTPNTGAIFSTNYSSGERRYGIVEVQFVEMTGAAASKQASVTTLHVSVVWAFLQK